MTIINQSAYDVLWQVKQLLNICNEEQYLAIDRYDSAPIGKHVRHILDHFLVFKIAIDTQLLDYNYRRRDAEIEKNLDLAKQEIADYLEWIKNVDLSDIILTIQTEISFDSLIHIRMTSTADRELVYIINHTVHHVAYISLLLKCLGEEQIPDNIGFASATLTYMRNKT